MRKEPTDAVAEAARRRLDALSRELAPAGVAGPAPEEPPPPEEPAPVPSPGRHARPRALPLAERASAWLRERLPASVQGRVGLGSSHLAVLALGVAVALAVAAFVVLRSRPEGSVVPPPRPAAALVTPAAAPSGAPPSKGATVVVDVAGKVRRPGVATLPAGSRVVDAIRRAGGATRGVDLSSLNLARVLVDGEQVLVGVRAASGVAPAAAAGAGAAAGPLLSLNSATQEQLEGLPGVGPVTAGKIMAWRQEHGGFTAVDDLLEVDGIGEKTLAELAPHVTL